MTLWAAVRAGALALSGAERSQTLLSSRRQRHDKNVDVTEVTREKMVVILSMAENSTANKTHSILYFFESHDIIFNK